MVVQAVRGPRADHLNGVGDSHQSHRKGFFVQLMCFWLMWKALAMSHFQLLTNIHAAIFSLHVSVIVLFHCH